MIYRNGCKLVATPWASFLKEKISMDTVSAGAVVESARPPLALIFYGVYGLNLGYLHLHSFSNMTLNYNTKSIDTHMALKPEFPRKVGVAWYHTALRELCLSCLLFDQQRSAVCGRVPSWRGRMWNNDSSRYSIFIFTICYPFLQCPIHVALTLSYPIH